MYTKLGCSKDYAQAETEVGSINSINTGAFSESFSSNTVSLSKSMVYNAYHGTHIYQSVPYLNDNDKFGWNPRLDSYWESSSGMDWADAFHYTYPRSENGKRQL